MTDLLGLTLADASERLRSAGLPVPSVIRTEPPRPRIPFPEAEARWRVVQVRPDALVIAPPIERPVTCSD